jgi:luciferase family oxidoreductase group 1
MQIGLLDFGVRSSNINSLAIIEDVVNYAVMADQLGYSRFWLAEHHNFDPLGAWVNPEVLIPILAGSTDRIRIGAGGIILANHSPYRIAYTFKLLNNLYNNRIDLGIAKGYTTRNINNANDDHHQKETKETVEEKLKNNTAALLEYLCDEDNIFKKEIIIPPYKGAIPELWSLTGSYRNFDQLARQGLYLSRSLFHHGSDISFQKDQLAEYKELFYTIHHKMPKVSIAFSGACSKDGTKAKKSHEHYSYGFITDNIVGCPSLFQDQLLQYQEDYNIDEFIFMNVSLHPDEREESISLIAETMQLNM